jgi:hypothetical protein
MAALAWEAYVAVLRVEAADPSLQANSYWKAVRESAFARFRAVFEASA